MAIKSFKRYEKKYLLNQSQYDELIKRISEYMDADERREALWDTSFWMM